MVRLYIPTKQGSPTFVLFPIFSEKWFPLFSTNSRKPTIIISVTLGFRTRQELLLRQISPETRKPKVWLSAWNENHSARASEVNTVPKLVFSFPLDWVASFIWLILLRAPLHARQCLWHWGQRSAPDTDPAFMGHLEAVAGCPGLCPNPTGPGDRQPPPTWPYYLTLMTLMVAFYFLGCHLWRQILRRQPFGESQQDVLSALLTWSFWQRYATFESKLISITLLVGVSFT